MALPYNIMGLCAATTIISALFLTIEGSRWGVPLPKVAVVGGGLGGATAAYRLKKIFGEELPQIDVYEMNQVGGRLKVINIDGKTYEVGGTIIHPDNQHMKDFVADLGLKRYEVPSKNYAMFDMQTKVFQPSESSWMSTLQMLWRYGMSLLNLRSTVNHMLADFNRIYKWQNEHQSFTTLPNLLMSMSDEMVASGQETLRKHLSAQGVSDTLINELVTVATRVNYGQSPDNMNGLSGTVSVAGAAPGLWNVRGGNFQVPEGLLRVSGAKLIKNQITRVVNISSEINTPKFRLETANGGSQDYDAIVIAVPMIKDVQGVNFAGFENSFTNYAREYHKLYVYIVKGSPNYNYFGYSSEQEMPSNIFPINRNDFYNSLSVIHSVDGDSPVYKVFANSKLDDDQLDKLFSSRKVTKEIVWYGYPKYSDSMEYVPFVLAPKLYYANTIELAASAMEMASIGGYNVANLLIHQWLGNDHLIDNMFVIEEKHIKIEL